MTLPPAWYESTNFVAVFRTVAPVVLKAVWTKPPAVAHSTPSKLYKDSA